MTWPADVAASVARHGSPVGRRSRPGHVRKSQEVWNHLLFLFFALQVLGANVALFASTSQMATNGESLDRHLDGMNVKEMNQCSVCIHITVEKLRGMLPFNAALKFSTSSSAHLSGHPSVSQLRSSSLLSPNPATSPVQPPALARRSLGA